MVIGSSAGSAMNLPTSYNDDVVIKASHLGKLYPLYNNRRDRLKQALFGSFHTYYKPFWALRDICLEVSRGERIGILGRNGSGKTTLLQMICGMTSPTKGELLVKGSVAPILALGGAFDLESTGRANIVIGGSVMGLKRRVVKERLDSIIEFAGIGDFVDQPLKYYSSGMKARLAFALCAHADADILVVDEALAVGDSAFQKRCMDWIERFCTTGTLLFVSHSMDDVFRLCRKAVWIENGTFRQVGDPHDVAKEYSQAMASGFDEHM